MCFDDIYTVGGDKEAKTREEGRAASFNAPVSVVLICPAFEGVVFRSRTSD